VGDFSRDRRATGLITVAALLVVAAIAAPFSEAAVDVSTFSVTPSTTAAGGHPNLAISVAFAEPTTGVKDIALHLPAGLTANPNAFAYCSRRRLVRYICPAKSRLGSFTVVVLAYGIQLPFRADLYNMRPAPTERVRIGTPIPTPKQVLAGVLPIRQRPADGGLDVAVTGLPQEVPGGIVVRVVAVKISLMGTVRRKVRKKWRRRSFLTNPTTCVPATSVLELTTFDVPPTVITKTSSYTPTGCA
jgi:hypothetical protein